MLENIEEYVVRIRQNLKIAWDRKKCYAILGWWTCVLESEGKEKFLEVGKLQEIAS